MGCCYSFFCKDGGNSPSGEPSETTRLLVDPVSNNSNILHTVSSENLYTHSINSIPKKTDEQSAMHRILHETSTRVIDVATLDSHNLQQGEYLERMKQYNQRIQQPMIANKLKAVSKVKINILEDIGKPEKILASEPIKQEDVHLIGMALVKAASAVSDIRIEHKEELVVPFRVPG